MSVYQVIHPAQLPVVNQAFTPSPDKISWAKGLIHAFQLHQQSGKVHVRVRGCGFPLFLRELILQITAISKICEIYTPIPANPKNQNPL